MTTRTSPIRGGADRISIAGTAALAGRRKALLDTHGAGSLSEVLTNTGRRELGELEVHALG